MAVLTAANEWDNGLTSELQVRYGRVSGSVADTYTPSNSTGKTVRVLGINNNTTGSAVSASVSGGTITITNPNATTAGNTGSTYIISYALEAA